MNFKVRNHCSSLALFLIIAFTQTAIPEEQAPRAARSVHLWYPAPQGTVFYNEMTVLESHRGSYFMACGFNHGYFGIQEIRGKEDKVVIFSVWDPGNQNDPNAVPPDQRVKVLYEGESVNVSRFGNEGTGGKSMFPYQWKIGETYKFMVKADVDGSRTTYEAYFYLNESQEWKHLATFQTLTNGDYLTGYYSFIEDFWRNGESAGQIRRAKYGNGWVKTIEGHWTSLTQARFTADKTPSDNINAALTDDGWFLLQNGGDTQNITPLRSTLSRLPHGLVMPTK
ncbi:MAG: DUF3472 domain-containing protein [Candidatus Omnitrophica bacterium]|nr:DUF3472 domain-containing protein [Candidatus Omnitrophota bacterium]